MSAKDWLEENEWENKPVDSEAWSHYTMLDTIMEEYAKHYMKEELNKIKNQIKINKFI
mgnify:CR=1 FL=1|tara:strand:- start:685 stop:858 length:174 start_codon:yes stop_codon:yes gene_type:complete